MRTIIFCSLLQLCSLECFSLDFPEFDLTIRLSQGGKRMEVEGMIRLPRTKQQRESIQLALSELMEDLQMEVVEPQTSAGAARLEKKYRAWSRPGWGTNTWTITPLKPFPPDLEPVLRFHYSASGDKSSFIFSARPDCFFAAGIGTAWYPQLEESPRNDDGLRLKGLRSKGILRFIVPSGFSVYSPGRQTKSMNRFTFEISVPVFFSFAAAKYSVSRLGGTIPTSLFQLTDRGKRMDLYVARTQEVLRVLGEEFGKYPYTEFAITEVPSDQANDSGFAGAGVDGFIMATTDFLNQKYNTAYYGHEVGHQWWGGLIRPEGLDGRWIMTESMAQFGSLRAVEELEGAAKAELYRRRGYPGYLRDQCGFGYLGLAATGKDRPLSNLPMDGTLPRWIADSKGFFVWDMLSREIGRQKFSTILKQIVARHSGKRITLSNFLNEIAQRAGRNLDWYFEQWFHRTGAPDFQLRWNQQAKTLKINISQTDTPFESALDLVVKGKNREQFTRRVRVTRLNESMEMPVEFAVDTVELDPHFLVLRWTEEYKKEAQALVPFYTAYLSYQEGQLEEAKALFEEGLRKLPEPDEFGLQFLLEFAYAQLLMDEKKIEEAKKHLENGLRSPVRKADLLPYAYLEMARIAENRNDQASICSALESVVQSEATLENETGAMDHARELARKHNCKIQFPI